MPLPKEFFLQQYQQTTGAAYIDPNHRDSVLVWKDSNPQSSNADKVVLFNTNSANAPIYLNSAISGLPSLYFDNNDILTSNNLVTMPLSAGSLNYSMFVVFNYDKTSIDTSAISCNISGIFSFSNSGETLIKVDRLDNGTVESQIIFYFICHFWYKFLLFLAKYVQYVSKNSQNFSSKLAKN